MRVMVLVNVQYSNEDSTQTNLRTPEFKYGQ